MTLEELDALPETGGFEQREELRDGKKVIIPVALEAFALYQGPDDPACVIDEHGVRWLIGWANGVRYKSRIRAGSI